MKCRWLLASVILGSCAVPAGSSVEETEPVPSERSFPESWVGVWQGTLVMSTKNGPREVPMRIEIGASDDPAVRPWVLTYGNQPRNYLLRAIDAATGKFAIDEQNGIVLPARWLGDTLLSRFVVGKQLLVTRQRFFADRIEHAIAVGGTTSSPTGQGVSTYEMSGLQRAVLRRAK